MLPTTRDERVKRTEARLHQSLLRHLEWVRSISGNLGDPSIVLLQPETPTGGGFPDDAFGWSVAVAGATVAVGAYGEQRVFLYTANASGIWLTSPSTTLATTAPYGHFGIAVAMTKHIVFVGQPDCQ